MNDVIIQSFSSTFISMLQIFFIILAAGLLLRKKVLSQENLQGLSVATVDVFLPCMVFTSIVADFRPGEFDIWWVLPLSGLLLTAVGMLLGWLFFVRELPRKRNMIPLAGVQNAGFMILPLGKILFPDRFDQFSIYVFMFTIGQSLPIWTIAKLMTTADPDARLRWQDMLTPPFIVTIVAVVVVFSGLHSIFFVTEAPQAAYSFNTILATIFNGVRLLGDATVPLMIFILGGVLGSIKFKWRAYFGDIIRVVFVKFLLLPLMVIGVLLYSEIGPAIPLLAVFFVIQSSSAPAISLVLQVKKYGGDEQKIGSMVLVCYLVCLFMLPFWVSVWQMTSSH
jgi:predicted permease